MPTWSAKGLKLARAIACIVAMSSLCAHAQSAIQGSVTDTSGATIPGAEITVTNTATNVSLPSRTNDQGLYTVSSLQPGLYTVTASQTGFEPASHTNIVLHISDNLVVDFSLKVGSSTSQVTVLATVPLINTSGSSLGQVIENRRIVDLPLDGQDPIALAGLSTGVTPVPPNANIHQGDNTPSINGAANFTSEVMIDGVPDTASRNGALDNFLIYTPTVDAVQEFKVETNSLGAEYGRFNGGVINIVMKSGGNGLHGSVYEFIRNSAADANYYFNKRTNTPLAPIKRNQFGFAVGGPVVIPHLYNGHNTMFFFGDFEGYRETLGTPGSFTVPTALERTGDFSQSFNSAGQLIKVYDPATLTTVNGVQQRSQFPNNVIPASRLDPVAMKLVNYYPLPNNKNLTSNLVLSPAISNTSNTGDVRIDKHFGDRDQAFIRASLQYPFTGSANYYGNPGTFSNPPLSSAAKQVPRITSSSTARASCLRLLMGSSTSTERAPPGRRRDAHHHACQSVPRRRQRAGERLRSDSGHEPWAGDQFGQSRSADALSSELEALRPAQRS